MNNCIPIVYVDNMHAQLNNSFMNSNLTEGKCILNAGIVGGKIEVI